MHLAVSSEKYFAQTAFLIIAKREVGSFPGFLWKIWDLGCFSNDFIGGSSSGFCTRRLRMTWNQFAAGNAGAMRRIRHWSDIIGFNTCMRIAVGGNAYPHTPLHDIDRGVHSLWSVCLVLEIHNSVVFCSTLWQIGPSKEQWIFCKALNIVGDINHSVGSICPSRESELASTFSFPGMRLASMWMLRLCDHSHGLLVSKPGIPPLACSHKRLLWSCPLLPEPRCLSTHVPNVLVLGAHPLVPVNVCVTWLWFWSTFLTQDSCLSVHPNLESVNTWTFGFGQCVGELNLRFWFSIHHRSGLTADGVSFSLRCILLRGKSLSVDDRRPRSDAHCWAEFGLDLKNPAPTSWIVFIRFSVRKTVSYCVVLIPYKIKLWDLGWFSNDFIGGSSSGFSTRRLRMNWNQFSDGNAGAMRRIRHWSDIILFNTYMRIAVGGNAYPHTPSMTLTGAFTAMTCLSGNGDT